MTGELRVLVVDDERLGRVRLERLLAREPGVRLVASCRSVREALRQLDGAALDGLFLDIEMPGGSGLELAQKLRERDLATVFVTAHAQHAATAFDLEAVDYLLKPFDDARFTRALQRLRETVEARVPAGVPLRRVPVETNGRVRLLELGAVDWIEADDKQVLLHTANETWPLRRKLSAIEQQLDPAHFARIHRRAIVRLGAIAELGRAFHGDWIVTLKSGRQLVLSRRYRHRLGPMLP